VTAASNSSVRPRNKLSAGEEICTVDEARFVQGLPVDFWMVFHHGVLSVEDAFEVFAHRAGVETSSDEGAH